MSLDERSCVCMCRDKLNFLVPSNVFWHPLLSVVKLLLLQKGFVYGRDQGKASKQAGNSEKVIFLYTMQSTASNICEYHRSFIVCTGITQQTPTQTPIKHESSHPTRWEPHRCVHTKTYASTPTRHVSVHTIQESKWLPRNASQSLGCRANTNGRPPTYDKIIPYEWMQTLPILYVPQFIQKSVPYMQTQ